MDRRQSTTSSSTATPGEMFVHPVDEAMLEAVIWAASPVGPNGSNIPAPLHQNLAQRASNIQGLLDYCLNQDDPIAPRASNIPYPLGRNLDQDHSITQRASNISGPPDNNLNQDNSIAQPSTFSQNMSENIPPPSASAAGDVPGQPYYEKTRKHLQDLLRKKAMISNSLANLEDQIYKKETEYLEETPSGNIITGFENYTKGTSSGIGGGRKRGNAVEGNRVFSKSSISYNSNAGSPMPSAHSTPVAAMAPTPLSTSFLKGEGASNHATPTSATSANRTGAGLKKKKREAGEDSETEKEGKKSRTTFGATRK